MPARDEHKGDNLRVVSDLLGTGLLLLAYLLKAHTPQGGSVMSILLTAVTSCFMPRVQACSTCSQVHRSWRCQPQIHLHHLPQSVQHGPPGPRDREKKAQLRSRLGHPLPIPIAGSRPPWRYLRDTCDHVLKEVPRGVDGSDVAFLGLQFPRGDVDGDATLLLHPQLVQHPGVLEAAFAHLDQEWEGKPQGHPCFQSCPSTKKNTPK